MKAYKTVRVQTLSFISSALYGDAWLASRPSRSIPVIAETLETVWSFWRRENIVLRARNQNSIRLYPTRSIVVYWIKVYRPQEHCRKRNRETHFNNALTRQQNMQLYVNPTCILFFLVLYSRGAQNLTKIWKPPQNSRRQKGGGHEASSVLSTREKKS